MWHGRNVAHVVGWPLVQAKALAASGALQDRFHTLPVAAEFLNDLHAYDLNGTAWTDLSAAAAGTPPSARCAHGLASIEGKLYVHGGESDSGERDGLHGRGREQPGLLRPACWFPSPNGLETFVSGLGNKCLHALFLSNRRLSLRSEKPPPRRGVIAVVAQRSHRDCGPRLRSHRDYGFEPTHRERGMREGHL